MARFRFITPERLPHHHVDEVVTTCTICEKMKNLALGTPDCWEYGNVSKMLNFCIVLKVLELGVIGREKPR